MNLTDIELLYNCQPTPSIILKPDYPRFSIAAVNTAFLKSTHTSHQELIGQPLFNIFVPNPDDDGSRNQQLVNALKEVIATKQTFYLNHHRYDLPDASGHNMTVHYWRIESSPLLDSSGNIKYIVQTSIDITEQYSKQKELDRNNRKINRILESITDGFFAIDKNETIIYWNNAAERLSGKEREKVIQTQLSDLYEDTNFTNFKRFHQQAVLTNSSVQFEEYFTESNSWFELTIYPTDEGASVYFKSINYRKEAEQRNKEADQRNLDLFNFSPVPMFAIDSNTLQILAANNAAQRDYGYTLSEFLESTIGILWPPETGTYLKDQIKRVLNTESTETLIVRLVTKNEEALDIELTSGSLSSWGADNKILMARDVSEKIRAKRAISLSLELEHLEKNVLELSARKEVSISDVLSFYTLGIQSLFPGLFCSIMQARDGRLYNWASSLPENFKQQIDGLPIADQIGSCGTAAFLKQLVIVSDLSKDPRWAEFKTAAEEANLKACWSLPVVDSEGKVMATLAMYYQEVKTPNPEELKIIERTAALLKIILENGYFAKSVLALKKRYTDLFHLSPLPMWVYDIDSLRILDVNKAAIQHYGYDETEFLNLTIEQLLPSEDIPKSRAILANVIKKGKSFQWTSRQVKKSGEIIMVTTRGNAIKYDDIPARIVVSVDETEKLNAEKALILSEHRFKTLVQGGSDLIAILDTEGIYKYVSPNAERVIGLKAADLMGRNSLDFVFNEYWDQIYREFDQQKNQHTIELSPVRFINSDNKTRWMETVLTDMRDDPHIDGYLANSRDVTQRIEYIKAVEQHNNRLREIGWAQAHLVRAPLARIIGMVTLIAAPDTDQETLKTLLSYLEISARELDQIIKEIIIKSETGDQP